MEEIRLTSWYGKYPSSYRVSYIPSGAGFLPSTEASSHLRLKMTEKTNPYLRGQYPQFVPPCIYELYKGTMGKCLRNKLLGLFSQGYQNFPFDLRWNHQRSKINTPQPSYLVVFFCTVAAGRRRPRSGRQRFRQGSRKQTNPFRFKGKWEIYRQMTGSVLFLH